MYWRFWGAARPARPARSPARSPLSTGRRRVSFSILIYPQRYIHVFLLGMLAARLRLLLTMEGGQQEQESPIKDKAREAGDDGCSVFSLKRLSAAASNPRQGERSFKGPTSTRKPLLVTTKSYMTIYSEGGNFLVIYVLIRSQISVHGDALEFEI